MLLYFGCCTFGANLVYRSTFGLYFQNVVGQFYYNLKQFYFRCSCIFGVVLLVQNYFKDLPLVYIFKMFPILFDNNLPAPRLPYLF